jgi:hypothetical protein
VRFRLLFALVTGLLVFGTKGVAQTQAPQAIAHFTGTGPQVTDPFTVADAWVVRWTAFRIMNISVLGPDGSLVAGAAGPRGALYVAKGGTYHLQIDYTAPPGASPTPTPTPGRPGIIDISGRPYQIQVVQQSAALATPSATSWVMENFNLPGKGVASFSGLNGTFTPPTPVPFNRPSPPSPAPANGNNTPAPPMPSPASGDNPPPASGSAPPPDAGA